jgi:hypothetical protein
MGRAMESNIRAARVQALKARAEMCRLRCVSFERQLAADGTAEQKSQLYRCWNQTIKESHAIRHALGLLEQQEKDEMPTLA